MLKCLHGGDISFWQDIDKFLYAFFSTSILGVAASTVPPSPTALSARRKEWIVLYQKGGGGKEKDTRIQR